MLASVGALGGSCVMTQPALMRELLGAFAGNEMVLGVALGLWPLLMGIDAWMRRTSEKLRHPLAALASPSCHLCRSGFRLKSPERMSRYGHAHGPKRRSRPDRPGRLD